MPDDNKLQLLKEIEDMRMEVIRIHSYLLSGQCIYAYRYAKALQARLGKDNEAEDTCRLMCSSIWEGRQVQAESLSKRLAEMLAVSYKEILGSYTDDGTKNP